MLRHITAVAAVVDAGLNEIVGTEVMPAPLLFIVIAVTVPEPAKVALTVNTAPVPVVSPLPLTTVIVGAAV